MTPIKIAGIAVIVVGTVMGTSYGITKAVVNKEKAKEITEWIKSQMRTAKFYFDENVRVSVNDTTSCINSAIWYFDRTKDYKEALKKCFGDITFGSRATTLASVFQTVETEWEKVKTNMPELERLFKGIKEVKNNLTAEKFCNHVKGLAIKSFATLADLENGWEIYSKVCTTTIRTAKNFWWYYG